MTPVQDEMNQEALLDIAIEAGYRLLENGAEINRVEESMQRILQAYGIRHCDVFAIPSVIIVTLYVEGAIPQTRIKRIYSRETNLDQITQLNALCRRICATTPDFHQIKQDLTNLDARPANNLPVQVFAFALIAFAFTLFFGGALADACVAALSGLAMKMVVHALTRFRTNPFFINLAGSAMATLIAYAAVRLNLAGNLDKIIIGALMNLVPGVAITTSMQDIIAGDLIAGLTKLTEALLAATALALGAGLALTLLRLF